MMQRLVANALGNHRRPHHEVHPEPVHEEDQSLDHVLDREPDREKVANSLAEKKRLLPPTQRQNRTTAMRCLSGATMRIRKRNQLQLPMSSLTALLVLTFS